MPYLFGLIFALLSMFQKLGNEVRPEKFCLDSAWNGTECHQLQQGAPLCQWRGRASTSTAQRPHTLTTQQRLPLCDGEASWENGRETKTLLLCFVVL